MREAILRLLWYFDVFKHPLSMAELTRFVAPGQAEAVQAEVVRLAAGGHLARTGRYCHRPGPQGPGLVTRREARVRAAERIWPRAQQAAAILGRLPFVEGVLITGSLSKGATDPDGDVDFLLLVAPGRVWSIKSATQVVRRALPEQARDLFCTNYLLATDALSLPLAQRNLFTAVELSTAVPMHGPVACADFLEANRWACRFVPGLDWSLERARQAPHRPPSRLRPPLERLWTDRIAARAEQASLYVWDRYWNRKYGWLDTQTRARRFQRTASTATNHLHDFQDYVLQEVCNRLEAAGLADTAVRL